MGGINNPSLKAFFVFLIQSAAQGYMGGGWGGGGEGEKGKRYISPILPLPLPYFEASTSP